MITRRRLLQLGGAAAISLPLAQLARRVRAGNPTGVAKRFIVMYFPDGVVGQSQAGDPSLWDAAGGGPGFTLPDVLASLAPYQSKIVLTRGLSMGPTDEGSHPGGAKKLLTATDGGNGISLDQHLATTVGASDPFNLLYLGAQTNADNPSSDMFISYVAPGTTTAPDDDPVAAFNRVFGGAGMTSGGGGGSGDPAAVARRTSILDNAQAEITALERQLGTTEKAKLDLHLQALRDVETRIQTLGGGAPSCAMPSIDATGLDSTTLYQPEYFPQILKAQSDLLVQAMACGLTRIGVIQSSHHTSNLIMSRFANSALYEPGFDMRSHQASHYGASHDPSVHEYADYLKQVTWWAQQYAYLLSQLDARPEGDGTMLDNSLVLLCTEICDGNTHSHDDMPFILAGGGGGAIKTGQLLAFDYHRHADLLLAIGNAMGDPMTAFGDSSSGPLPGLLA